MSDLKDTRYLDGIWMITRRTNTDDRKMVRETLAAAHSFRPTDKRAVFVFNSMEQVKQFEIITLACRCCWRLSAR